MSACKVLVFLSCFSHLRKASRAELKLREPASREPASARGLPHAALLWVVPNYSLLFLFFAKHMALPPLI